MLNEEQLALLTDWFQISEQLKELRARESNLRDYIFEVVFPNLEPDDLTGTHTAELPNGFELVAVVPNNISIDQETVEERIEALTPKQQEDIGYWEFKLDKKAYNNLSKSAQKKFGTCLSFKPGKVALKVRPVAEDS